MIEFALKGGLLVWPIMLVSVIAVGIFLERLSYYHRITIRVGDFLQGLSNLVRRRNIAEALHECAATPGPVARVIHAALINADRPRAELKDIVQESGQLEVPRLERNLGVLHTLAHLAPLMGLLGTVLGMVETFTQISAASGLITANELSYGIYRSLLTTALGLGVAIPVFVGYSFLSSRVKRLMHDMERGGIEIVNMLTERDHSADIIQFRNNQREAAGR